MTAIELHLTLADLLTSTIIYGIVHGTWKVIMWCIRGLETEAGRIIDAHVKSGHEDRFKVCFTDTCAIPGTERRLTLPTVGR